MSDSKEKAKAALLALPKGRLQELVRRLDGHSIADPARLVAAGWPSEAIEECTMTHRSGKSPKESIFRRGEIVEELRGVHLLTLAWLVAEAVGADTENASKMFGRGSQAMELVAAVLRKLGS